MTLPLSLTPLQETVPSRNAKRRLRHMVAVLTLAAFPGIVYAGQPSASHSNVPGYFLGSVDEGAYIDSGHSKQYIDEIRAVCKRKNRIWALGITSTLRCTGFEFHPEAAVYLVRIEPQQPSGVSDPGRIRLLSVRPFPGNKWESRPATEAEVAGVAELFKNDNAKLKAVKRAFASGKAMVLDSPDKNATTFVLFWKRVSAGLPDPKVSNPQYVVAVERKKQFSDAGEIVGHIVGMVDLNEDGIPEFHISEDCDGSCESVISLDKKIKIEISSH